MKKRLLIVCGCGLTVLALVGTTFSHRGLWKLAGRPNKQTNRLEFKSSSNSWLEDELSEAAVQPITTDQLLVTVGDTLYLVNSQQEVLWQVTVGDLVDVPIVDSATGMIYGVAVDKKQFSVELATGKVKVFEDRSVGRAFYAQIERYKEDQYLVVTIMQGYRDNFPDQHIPDHLTVWRGEDAQWSAEIPPNAKIETWGERILAVTKEKNKMIVTEIKRPEQEVR